MEKPNVFIRGIYSTALTKMFLDAGYQIIFPSDPIKKRFDIPFRPKDSYSKDITIKDRFDRQGVRIMFKKNVWDSLVENEFKDFPLCQSNYPDLIEFQARFHMNSIYRGLVVSSNKNTNFSQIRLTPEEVDKNGALDEDALQTTFGRYSRFLPEGKEGVFQITHEDCGKYNAQLGSFYTIPGDLIVIVPYDSKVIISKEILEGRQKKRLFDLGKSIQNTKKYGFIFRTAAELATDKEIIEEVNKLEEDLIKTQNIITQFPDRIGEIYCNYRAVNLIFPMQFKLKLDQIRRNVMPTIEYHHAIKSDRRSQANDEDDDEGSNSDVDMLLDYTERMMKELPKETHPQIYNFFLNFYLENSIQTRQEIDILHQKLDGKMIQLSYGYIHSVDKDPKHPIRIKIRRKMREGGLYDGIGTPIEDGDYAIGEYEEGSWFYCTTYYAKNNDVKGKYFNINTPLEIRKGCIRYVDLEIDVVENMMGVRKIIDEEKLAHALDLKIISQEIHDKAKTLAQNIFDKKI